MTDEELKQQQEQEKLKQQQAVNTYDELAAKKGWSGEEGKQQLAKSYTESEAELGRRQTALDTAKKQVEQQSSGTLSIDKDGNVVDIKTGQPPVQQQPQVDMYGNPIQPQGGGYQQPQSGQQQYDQYGNPIQPQGGHYGGQGQYDPYSGQLITNPVTLQLLNQIPDPVQRQMFITNHVIQQNQKFEQDAFKADQEVLSKPEAKGFEADVRRVMQQVPLQQRATKQAWEDALLKIKGAKYDEAMKNAGTEGVNAFINKNVNQNLGGAGGGKGGTQLDAQQEQTYQWYTQHQPGKFKDRQHFLNACSPTGGR